jgi:hypothetical protein
MRMPAASGALGVARCVARAGGGALVVLLAWVAGAHGDAAAARAMLLRYAGSYDSAPLLQEPVVRAELARLLGPERGHLERNLDVSGSVDVIGGVLAVSGNAPHRGTEEEAVVCVVPPGSAVEAAILSRGVVTVFTRAPDYAQVTLCVKDWITLANAGHADRLKQPGNVRLAAPSPAGDRPR